MVDRPYWLEKLKEAWSRRSVVWLAGVRRAGKTTLAKMVPDAVMLNCDLPSTLRRVEDPELFFNGLKKGSTIIFDEIHRLPDPALTLKIASDAFPHFKILATGSSTLAATRKFRDTLAGRKIAIRLAPILWTECKEPFGIPDLDRRLLCGGLPEPFLAGPGRRDDFYAEWLDSFYARDVQELFGIRERTGFLKLLNLMLWQSGGLADYSSLSREVGLSRATIKSHLEAMAAALALSLVPPFSGKGRREITKRPKIYGFDTGFVAFAKGWESIRDTDRGVLWEHLVLDALRCGVDERNLYYWRDKSGKEIDFVVTAKKGEVHAVECKINPDRVDPASLSVFRRSYPLGRNYAVCPHVDEPYDRRVGDMVVRVTGCRALMKELLVLMKTSS